MCYSCWQELDSPSIINEKTLEACRLLKLVDQAWPISNHLHIIIEDFNVEESCVKFCMEAHLQNRNQVSEKALSAERDCLELLSQLTEDEVASAMALYEGFINGNSVKP